MEFCTCTKQSLNHQQNSRKNIVFFFIMKILKAQKVKSQIEFLLSTRQPLLKLLERKS